MYAYHLLRRFKNDSFTNPEMRKRKIGNIYANQKISKVAVG